MKTMKKMNEKQMKARKGLTAMGFMPLFNMKHLIFVIFTSITLNTIYAQQYIPLKKENGIEVSFSYILIKTETYVNCTIKEYKLYFYIKNTSNKKKKIVDLSIDFSFIIPPLNCQVAGLQKLSYGYSICNILLGYCELEPGEDMMVSSDDILLGGNLAILPHQKIEELKTTVSLIVKDMDK
jgi:hypothetical protein